MIHVFQNSKKSKNLLIKIFFCHKRFAIKTLDNILYLSFDNFFEAIVIVKVINKALFQVHYLQKKFYIT